MKSKTVLVILSIFLIFIVACQQPAKTVTKINTPAPSATGEAAVDAVGKNLNTVVADENDLSADNLTDVDAGLADMQNI